MTRNYSVLRDPLKARFFRTHEPQIRTTQDLEEFEKGILKWTPSGKPVDCNDIEPNIGYDKLASLDNHAVTTHNRVYVDSNNSRLSIANVLAGLAREVHKDQLIEVGDVELIENIDSVNFIGTEPVIPNEGTSNRPAPSGIVKLMRAMLTQFSLAIWNGFCNPEPTKAI